jgi:hypothetical protein
MRRPARALAAIAPVAVLALLPGCFNPFDPRLANVRGESTPPPEPNSPENVVRLFEWCWNNRAIEEYRGVFSEDYTFQFAVLDTFGNAYRERPWRYEDEVISTTNIFVGGSPTEPPATGCDLTLDPTLIVVNDPRPGKDPGWHKQINTNVDLRIATDDQEYRITGRARFFLVRGDSATIPPDLGIVPSPNRWFIERWEDETLPETGPAFAAAPAGGAARATASGAPAPGSLARFPRVTRASAPSFPVDVSWGSIRAFYRSSDGP